MTASGPETRRARARAADEETRYQAVADLDPSDAADREVLLERLADPSWRVRAAVAERLSRTPDPVALVPALADSLVGGASVGARDAAAVALSRLGGPALPLLVERMDSPDPELRIALGSILGAIGDRRAVPPLAARLADEDPNVRAAAAEALGRIGGPEATSALQAALDSDDATLRLTALDALVRLRTAVPVAALERLLADRGMRRAAFRLAGVCDLADAIGPIALGLREPSRAVREAALGALGAQRARHEGKALEPLLREVRIAAERDPALVDAWAAGLGAEDGSVALGALTAVGATGGARHAAAFLRLAEDDRLRPLVEEAVDGLPAGPELRTALAEALPSLGQLSRLTALASLARLGSPAAFESIVREASDPGSYVQSEAVAALGRLRDARGVAPLAGLLGDDGPAVAGLASAALVRLAQPGEPGREAVLSALRDRAEASPSAALYRTLGAVGEAADLDALRAGLAEEAAVRRAAAISAIGGLAKRGLLRGRPVPELPAAFADPAWQVRLAAARALSEAASGGWEGPEPGEEAAKALRAVLGDAEPVVRAAAVEALGALGRQEDVADIEALASDPASPAPVAVAALRALIAAGALSREAVARAAAHPDPEVLKEAVLAAARIPGADGERILRRAAGSARWDVRQAAARAMAERGDRALAAEANRLSASDPDPLVARAFAEAARTLGAK